MNFKFAKSLLIGSAFTMGAFGLVACGDDSSSGPKENNKPEEIVIPQEHDNIIKFTNLSKVDAGTIVKFNGSIELVFDDTSSSQHLENLRFTDMTLKVGKVNGAGLTATSATVLYEPVAFPREQKISLNEMNTKISLDDPTFTECGDFKLIVTANATDGANDFASTETIDFNRPEAYCAALSSSSQNAPESAGSSDIPMVATEIKISTNLYPGIILATGTAVDAASAATADLIFSKAGNGEVAITSGTGILFSPIDNETITASNYDDDYEVNYWPETNNGKGTAVVKDFLYRSIQGTEINDAIENSQKIYVAKNPAIFNEATGAGFYAFAIAKYAESNNKNFDLTIKLYSVK